MVLAAVPALCLGMMLVGANLGGWLVLEPWMSSSSAFVGKVPAGTPPTEFAISKALAAQGLSSLITEHRNTFVTTAHLDKLVSLGVNYVRVPLGHWATAGTTPSPYVPGALGRLDWLFAEAGARGLKVLLSMHAAPGSQNGFDHSSPETLGVSGWCTSSTQQRATLARLREWTRRYATNPAMLGVSLLNEPGCDRAVLEAFYANAYTTVRADCASCLVVAAPNVYSQGGDVRGSDWRAAELRAWAAWGTGRTRVALDLHSYQTDWAIGADTWANMTVADHITYAQNTTADRLAAYAAIPGATPLLVGEWSTAGPRFSADDAGGLVEQQAYGTAQCAAFTAGKVMGTAFWSLRTDASSAWSIA